MGSKTFKGGVHPYEGKELAKADFELFALLLVVFCLTCYTRCHSISVHRRLRW